MTHHKKRQLMVDTETKKRQDAVSQITCRMQKRVDSLTEEHDAVLKHKADYYSTLQKKLQQDQDKLKVQTREADQTEIQTNSSGPKCHKRDTVDVVLLCLVDFFRALDWLNYSMVIVHRTLYKYKYKIDVF